MERLHAFYLSLTGLNREAGLSIGDRPDFQGIGYLSVFLRRWPYISSSANSTQMYSPSCAFFSIRR